MIKKFLALVLVLFSIGFVSTPASAQVAVLCQSCETHLPIIDKTTASQLVAFNKYQLYMTAGIGGKGGISMGGGVIEQLQSLNDTLSEGNEQRTQEQGNNDQAARIRNYQNQINAITAEHMPTDLARSCIDATMAGGFSSGGGSGGGSSNAKGPSAPVVAERQQIMDRNYSPVANSGSKMLAHVGNGTIGYCSAEDRVLKRLGCTGEGNYPQADTNAQNLTTGAQKPGDPSPSLPVLNATQTQIATAVINQAMPTIPAGVPKGAQSSPQANLYNVDANEVKARLSFADKAMTDAISMYGARTDLPSTYAQIWKGAADSDDFKRVYGTDATPPALPSQYMIYDFAIMRQLTDPEIMGGEGSKSPQAIAADQYKMQLLQAKMQLDQLAATKENGRLLAILIAQSIDPKTTADLKSRLGTLTNTGTSN